MAAEDLNGTSHNYRVSTYGSPLRIHMLVDVIVPPCGGGGQGCSVTDFSPFDPSSGWVGTQSQWFGETLNAGNDVPGNLLTEGAFFTTAQHTDGFGWLNQTFTQGVTCPFYHASVLPGSTDHFTIWTDPLPHANTGCS